MLLATLSEDVAQHYINEIWPYYSCYQYSLATNETYVFSLYYYIYFTHIKLRVAQAKTAM
jgi:hypothetical protein